jgi:carbonic anhydrase
MRISVFLTALLIVTTTLATAQTSATANTPWEYSGNRGALNWGKLDPAYKTCSQGDQQSPIDIRGAHLNKALQPIEFHYITGSVTLENDGHTIVVHVNPGSYMIAGGVRYELQQYEFHHPTEHAVQGKLTEMDVDLLHKSADGKVAIIAVRLVEDRDKPNAVLAMLWPHLPTTAGKTAKVTEMVNAGGLLPSDRGYWTYMGSLTRPPCTEGVRWFVFENEITLGREQLRAFTAIFKMNSRPLQGMHGRRIEANE